MGNSQSDFTNDELEMYQVGRIKLLKCCDRPVNVGDGQKCRSTHVDIQPVRHTSLTHVEYIIFRVVNATLKK